MNKSDLKTGMIVTTLSKEKFIVMLKSITNTSFEKEAEGNYLVSLEDGYYISLNEYNDDLSECQSGSHYAITKIENNNNIGSTIVDLLKLEKSEWYSKINTIYERQIKKIDLNEALDKLEQIYGCKVIINS